MNSQDLFDKICNIYNNKYKCTNNKSHKPKSFCANCNKFICCECTTNHEKEHKMIIIPQIKENEDIYKYLFKTNEINKNMTENTLKNLDNMINKLKDIYIDMLNNFEIRNYFIETYNKNYEIIEIKNEELNNIYININESNDNKENNDGKYLIELNKLWENAINLNKNNFQFEKFKNHTNELNNIIINIFNKIYNVFKEEEVILEKKINSTEEAFKLILTKYLNIQNEIYNSQKKIIKIKNNIGYMQKEKKNENEFNQNNFKSEIKLKNNNFNLKENKIQNNNKIEENKKDNNFITLLSKKFEAHIKANKNEVGNSLNKNKEESILKESNKINPNINNDNLQKNEVNNIIINENEKEKEINEEIKENEIKDDNFNNEIKKININNKIDNNIENKVIKNENLPINNNDNNKIDSNNDIILNNPFYEYQKNEKGNIDEKLQINNNYDNNDIQNRIVKSKNIKSCFEDSLIVDNSFEIFSNENIQNILYNENGTKHFENIPTIKDYERSIVSTVFTLKNKIEEESIIKMYRNSLLNKIKEIEKKINIYSSPKNEIIKELKILNQNEKNLIELLSPKNNGESIYIYNPYLNEIDEIIIPSENKFPKNFAYLNILPYCYVSGGINFDENGKTILNNFLAIRRRETRKFDFIKLSPMLETKYNHCMLELKYINAIIVIGGFNSKNCEYYNSKNNEWINLPELSHIRESPSCCVINETNIFCFLGYDNDLNKYNNSIEKLNFNSKNLKWEEIKPINFQQKMERKASSCLAYNHKGNNYIFIVGGIGNLQKESKDILIYDEKRNKLIRKKNRLPFKSSFSQNSFNLLCSGYFYNFNNDGSLIQFEQMGEIFFSIQPN